VALLLLLLLLLLCNYPLPDDIRVALLRCSSFNCFVAIIIIVIVSLHTG